MSDLHCVTGPNQFALMHAVNSPTVSDCTFPPSAPARSADCSRCGAQQHARGQYCPRTKPTQPAAHTAPSRIPPKMPSLNTVLCKRLCSWRPMHHTQRDQQCVSTHHITCPHAEFTIAHTHNAGLVHTHTHSLAGQQPHTSCAAAVRQCQQQPPRTCHCMPYNARARMPPSVRSSRTQQSAEHYYLATTQI
jgi:hypothetical protein